MSLSASLVDKDTYVCNMEDIPADCEWDIVTQARKLNRHKLILNSAGITSVNFLMGAWIQVDFKTFGYLYASYKLGDRLKDAYQSYLTQQEHRNDNL